MATLHQKRCSYELDGDTFLSYGVIDNTKKLKKSKCKCNISNTSKDKPRILRSSFNNDTFYVNSKSVSK
jgi:hypothetical protein